MHFTPLLASIFPNSIARFLIAYCHYPEHPLGPRTPTDTKGRGPTNEVPHGENPRRDQPATRPLGSVALCECLPMWLPSQLYCAPRNEITREVSQS